MCCGQPIFRLVKKLSPHGDYRRAFESNSMDAVFWRYFMAVTRIGLERTTCPSRVRLLGGARTAHRNLGPGDGLPHPCGGERYTRRIRATHGSVFMGMIGGGREGRCRDGNASRCPFRRVSSDARTCLAFKRRGAACFVAPTPSRFRGPEGLIRDGISGPSGPGVPQLTAH